MTTTHSPESTDPSALDRRTRARSRRTLMLLVLVTIAPVIAAYITFYFWQPSGRVNHGDLIDPVAIQWPQEAATLNRKWVMVYASSGACDEHCQQALYYMRQVRIAQAKEMDRVERAWVVLDSTMPTPATMQRQEGLVTLKAQTVDKVLQQTGHIQLVDPRGNVMMRFPAAPDPKLMIKDLQRLLKYSRIG